LPGQFIGIDTLCRRGNRERQNENRHTK
jgi:hypothetical protein